MTRLELTKIAKFATLYRLLFILCTSTQGTKGKEVKVDISPTRIECIVRGVTIFKVTSAPMGVLEVFGLWKCYFPETGRQTGMRIPKKVFFSSKPCSNARLESLVMLILAI